MVKRIIRIAGLLLLALVAVLVFNTLRFHSKQPAIAAAQPMAAPDSALVHLQQAIRFQTVSLAEGAPADTLPFIRFHDFLQRAYPLVFARLHLQKVNQLSLWFTWQGKDASLPPVAFMAHQDVVPVDARTAGNWLVPPFEGALKHGYIYGRGTCDDKASMVSILEAAEKLLEQGFQPQRTIYLIFGHDEEVGGKYGAAAIAALIKARAEKLYFVLDEGGMITKERVPGMEGRPVAVVGTAEKGYVSLELSVNMKGGHSSMPEKETVIDVLSGAITRLHESRFPRSLSQASEEFFEHLGPEMPFTRKVAIANLWLFKGVLFNQLGRTNTGDAMMRTTISPTIFQSGIKDNVIPGFAKAVINFRLLPGTSIEDVKQHVIRAVDDKRVLIKQVGFSNEATAVTPAESEPFRFVMKSIRQTFPSTTVAPFLCLGTTDARHFSGVAQAVLRFTPNTDLEGYHGTDERLSLNSYAEGIHFYYQMMKTL